jgi:hypothetical protein
VTGIRSNDNVIDTEVVIDDDGNRVDFAAFRNGTDRTQLVFYEARCRSNMRAALRAIGFPSGLPGSTCASNSPARRIARAAEMPPSMSSLLLATTIKQGVAKCGQAVVA